jgi:hypothetical protein
MGRVPKKGVIEAYQGTMARAVGSPDVWSPGDKSAVKNQFNYGAPDFIRNKNP